MLVSSALRPKGAVVGPFDPNPCILGWEANGTRYGLAKAWKDWEQSSSVLLQIGREPGKVLELR